LVRGMRQIMPDAPAPGEALDAALGAFADVLDD
jgi:hypothetical protein